LIGLNDQQLSRLRVAVLVLLSVVTTTSLVGTAFSPYLLVKSPLLLVALSPAAHHVVLAAASVDPASLVAVTTARRVLTCIGAYGLGFLYGGKALGWLDERYPRVARLVAWIERLFARWGVWLLILIPAPTVAVFAGAAHSHRLAFLVAITLGHVFWSAVTVYVGDAIAAWTDLLTTTIGDHLLESTLICIALVALQQFMSRRRRDRDLPFPPS
jgi:membrane protein DedA with SNARE-associated domain